MKDKELEIALNHDNIMTFSDCINTRIAYETVYQEKDKEIEKLNNIIKTLEKDIKNLYTYGIKNNAEQRDYLLNRLEGLKELKGDGSNE